MEEEGRERFVWNKGAKRESYPERSAPRTAAAAGAGRRYVFFGFPKSHD
jgi:hypothetical protein